MGKKVPTKARWLKIKCDTAMADKHGKKCRKVTDKCENCHCSMYLRVAGLEWVHFPPETDGYYRKESKNDI